MLFRSEAIPFYEQAVTIYPHPHFIACKGWVYGLAGRRQDALRILDELAETANRCYVSPKSFAWVYMGLEDRERWRTAMEAAFEERNGFLTLLHAPWEDTVRADPFFQDLIRRVGLPTGPATSAPPT